MVNFPKDKYGVSIVNKKKCKTCIFHPDQKIVTQERLAEIQLYLIKGTSHQCHNNKNVCRGSREYQATIFYRLGMILEDTVECLNEKIKQAIKK